jgi:hypothetical protein
MKEFTVKCPVKHCRIRQRNGFGAPEARKAPFPVAIRFYRPPPVSIEL